MAGNMNIQIISLTHKLIMCATLLFLFNSASANNNKLSDPTKPINYWAWYNSTQNTSVKISTKLNLQSILISENRKTAVINSQTAVEGARIHGANIIAINKNNVVINHNGYKQTLHLPKTTAVKKLRELKVNAQHKN